MKDDGRAKRLIAQCIADNVNGERCGKVQQHKLFDCAYCHNSYIFNVAPYTAHDATMVATGLAVNHTNTRSHGTSLLLPLPETAPKECNFSIYGGTYTVTYSTC